MYIEDISTELKYELQVFNQDVLMMSPYQIANFLIVCKEALLKYIEFSNQQLGQESQGYFGKDESKKINSLFRELGDNFFPMAHTNQRLGQLKIIDSDRGERLRDSFNELRNQMFFVARGIAEINNVSQELSTRIQQISDEFNDVTNP
jgi:methyl-accepting chemotaxis protein